MFAIVLGAPKLCCDDAKLLKPFELERGGVGVEEGVGVDARRRDGIDPAPIRSEGVGVDDLICLFPLTIILKYIF